MRFAAGVMLLGAVARATVSDEGEVITFASLDTLAFPTHDATKSFQVNDDQGTVTYQSRVATECNELWYGFLEDTVKPSKVAKYMERSKHVHCGVNTSSSLKKYYKIESEAAPDRLKCIFTEKEKYTDSDPPRQFAATRQGTSIVGDLADKAIREQQCYMMLRTFVSVQNKFLADADDEADQFPTKELEAAGNLRHSVFRNDRVMVSKSPVPLVRILPTRATLETCTDELRGFLADSLNAAELVDVMQEMAYERCKGPGDAEFDFQGHYRVETKAVKVPGHKQELRCTFHDLHSDDQPFHASRRGPRMGTGRKVIGFLERKLGGDDEREKGRFFFNRIQLGNDADKNAELKECLSMLNTFIGIHNRLIERGSLDETLMHVIDGSDRKVAAAEPESGGLGIGYIVLIVAGVLALIAGGYYMYRQMSSDAPRQPRRRRGNRTE